MTTRRWDHRAGLPRRADVGQGRPVLRDGTKLDPEDLDHFAEWGAAYWRRGDKAKAGELFAKVLTGDPETVRLYYKIGKGIGK